MKKEDSMNKMIIAVCFFLVVLTVNPGNIMAAQEETINTPKKTLLIGLIPERNLFEQLKRYEPLASYLSEKTGMEVKLRILTRYGNIIDNFVELGLDGAFFGSFTYTLAHARLGVEPIARPESPEGVSTYYGMVFVRRDSDIKSRKDMRGKIFAFVDKATTAGHLLPLAFFKENRIRDYKTFFKETYFTGTHEDAIYDVFNKRADIGAAKNTVYFEVLRKNDKIAKELIILKESPEVPRNGLAVRKDLDDSLKKILKEALLNIHNDPKAKKILAKINAKKFIETTDHDYKAVYDYVKAAGLDLANYDYMNE
jgi:phosphonate transport system substrate-binding protein